MKKLVGFASLLLLTILFSFFLVSAATDEITEDQKIDKAYSCLQNKTNGRCSALSTEEKIFSLLSIKQCQPELLSARSNSTACWSPTGTTSCRLKTTAQAVLALSNVGTNTDDAQNWLLSQNRTPTDLAWFLEIEAQSPATCTITYSGSSHTIDIGADKKINNNAGSCLTLAQDGYWLRVSPSCFNREFQVSCNQGFLTTLLFQKQNSATVHVSEEASSAAANGMTVERVKSSCFGENNLCNYEGTLWATLVLDSLGKDVSSNLPYLITLAEDNQRFLPDSFLYMITGNTDYKVSLLSDQKSDKWWLESGDKLYDTALALYPFQQETLQEKTNSKEWLLSTQDANGCWENNVRNTGFILASIWPRDSGDDDDDGLDSSGLPDCETAGYFCTSSGNCPSGSILSEYDCPALFNCCTTQPTQQTCFELGGEICSSGQSCSGDTLSSSDLAFGEQCCVTGVCGAAGSGGSDGSGGEDASACGSAGGTCRSFGCNSNEEELTVSCQFSGDSCCIQTTIPGGPTSYLWVWVLLSLIVLVVLAIVFRNHLRHFWFKAKDSFGGGRPRPGVGPSQQHYGFMPQPIRRPFPVERRILPHSVSQHQQQSRPSPGRSLKSRAEKELDDVLKKLKDMSK